jgi:hypothetical protein
MYHDLMAMGNISVHKTAIFFTNIIKLQLNYKCFFQVTISHI